MKITSEHKRRRTADRKRTIFGEYIGLNTLCRRHRA